METSDFLEIAGLVGSGGILTVLVQLYIAHLRNKTARDGLKASAETRLKTASDEMAVKLMEIADDRVSHWQAENLKLHTKLSQFRIELEEAKEAIRHLRAVVLSKGKAKSIAEREAQRFLDAIDAQEG
jgi:hypothetical protein